ncbi:hypothetical protein NFHSH190041_19320 [Shewanella sp. NFH-SH190041]|uniref:SMI1/KNR4 family protein n=1 Tax=Shewanella sp. NFH-SH190041 TaxID=2950245 RepID=UPI0021C3AE2A|nr:SMI1/KNR4 family protein [Shewanella sp. NFH-SH190041]BDM64480.1 hypothetical protein NFHSH190041_19320 [Shewanella sp. NFH-SH190041]
MNNDLLFKKLAKIAIPSPLFKPSEQDLLDFEQTNQVSLPNDFREFLLRWGGLESVEDYGNNEESYLIYPLKHKKFSEISHIIDCTITFEGMVEDYNQYGLPKFCLPFYINDIGEIFIYLKPDVNGEIYFVQNNFGYIRSSETDFIKNCEFDDACKLFDPQNNVIPYYFTKLANSFTDFIQQLVFIDGENFEEVYNECFLANKPLDISRLIQYELPENYSSHN